jgi:mevalonate kinase
MTTASAPGKVILCGEHAVVYGWPAIALPLSSVRATATVTNAAAGSGVTCDIPDSGERWVLADVSEQPLARLTALVFQRLGITAPPDLQIILRSTIPIASGMGSGAALGAALVKALAAHLGHTLTPAEVSGLVYEIERIYHGTPSGIDNTVVSYEQPIWFIRGNQNRPPIMEPLRLGASFSLVIGDTGTRAPTRVMVGAVRELWQRERSLV